MATDRDLLAAWRDGDRDAGDRLFNRHFASVYRFLSNKIHGDVEDLIQKIFLACVEGRDRFRSDASFRTYLFSIARRQLYRYWRDRRSGELDFTVSSLRDLGASPATAVQGREEQRLLLEALRRLPLELQIAVELHYWEDMTGPQIAEVLDLPEGTVRSRLRRARQAIEAALAELAGSGAVLASTVDNLDRWARSLKQQLAPR